MKTINYLRYFDVEIGNIPIILSCPHGGYKNPKSIQNIENGAKFSDRNTLFIARRIKYILKEKDFRPYIIFCKIHRSKLDLNRPPGSSIAFNQASAEARELHYYFQRTIKEQSKQSIKEHGKCLIIDFHGFTKPHKKYPNIIFGNIFSNTLSISKQNKNGLDYYWGLEELRHEFSTHFTLDDGLGVNDLNLAYSGGYITHLFYRKNRINALQLEVSETIRNNLNQANIFVIDFVTALLNCLDKDI